MPNQTRTYNKPFVGPRLNQELLAALPALQEPSGSDLGPRVLYTLTKGSGNNFTITVPDTIDASVVDAVVAAHDGTTPWPADVQAAADLSNVQDLANTYQAMLTAVGGIHAHMTAINNGPATPTNAQIGTALKTLATDLDTVVTGCQKLLNVVAVLVRRQAGT